MKRRAYQISALVLALLTLVGTWLLYRGDFLPLSTAAEQVEAIRQYASADKSGVSLQATLHPVPLCDEIIQNRRILTFSDEEIEGLLGAIEFRRGILGGWQPLQASYSAGPALQTLRLRDLDVLAVYAANCPPEIARYAVQANPENPDTRMAAGEVTAASFLHLHETDRDFFPSIYLYDAAGNELDSWAYQAIDQAVPSPGIGSAETNMIYVFCALFLGVGYLIVKYLWDLSKKETAAP